MELLDDTWAWKNESPQIPSNLALSSAHAKVCTEFNSSCWSHFLSHGLYQNPGVYCGQKIGGSSHMFSLHPSPVVIPSWLLAALCSRQTHVSSHQPQLLLSWRYQVFNDSLCILPLGIYSVSQYHSLCLLFITPASIPSFPCPMLAASSEAHQYLGDATLPKQPGH